MAFRLHPRLGTALAPGLVAAWACVQAANVTPLEPARPGVSGRVQLENVEGGVQLVTVELDDLPPPEGFASELTEFVVWLEDAHGARVNLGPLRYDRGRRSGKLMATTELRAFTVCVTGERHAHPEAPSDVLVASRNVTTH